MGSKGSTPTTSSQGATQQSSLSTYTPAPAATAAITGTMQQAQNVGQIPYQPYTGQQVAGFSPDQIAAMQGVRNMQGGAQPYIDAATGLAGAAATAYDPGQYAQNIEGYFNPFVNDVVAAQMANMGETNAQQQNALTGEAIRSGGMGGDRLGVARAEMARQQNLANFQTIANLLSGGWQNAQGQLAARQAAQQSGATQFGNIGSLGQNLTMQQLAALQQTGAQQQSLAQQQLDAAYKQYQQAQAYPYQQTGFQAGLVGSLAPSLGGTTYSTGSGTTAQQNYAAAPSGVSQGLGALVALAPFIPKTSGGRVGMQGGGDVIDMTKGQDGIFDYKGFIPKTNLASPHEHIPEAMKINLPDLSPPANTNQGGLGGLAGIIGGATDKQKEGLGNLGNDIRLAMTGGYNPVSPETEALALDPSASISGMPMADGGRIGMAPGGSSTYDKMLAQAMGNVNTGPNQAPTGDLATMLARLPASAPSAPAPAAAKAENPIFAQWNALRAKMGLGPLDWANTPYGALVGGGSSVASAPTAPAAPQTPVYYNYTMEPGYQMQANGLYAMNPVSPGFEPLYHTGAASGGRIGMEAGGDADLDPFMGALAKGETGGESDPYATIGPASRRGDRPYGKYQIMGENIPIWSKEAGFGALTPQEFLANKDAQEAIARHKFGQYVKQTGSPEEAAKMWFGGPNWRAHAGARDVLGTSIPQYAARFNKNLGSAPLAYSGDTAPTPPAGLGAINAHAGSPTGLGALPPGGETPPPAAPAAEEQGSGLLGLTPEGKQAMMMAGLAMMAGRSPNALTNIGEGGLAGVQAYQHAKATQEALAEKKAQQARLDAIAAETRRHNLMTEQTSRMAAEAKGEIGTIGTDELGNPITGWKSGPKAGQPVSIEGRQGATAGAGAIDWTKHGDEFLTQLPPSMQEEVRNIATARSELPKGFGSSKLAPLYRAVVAYDPDFSMRTYAAKKKMFTDYNAASNPTSAGGQLIAANTAIMHAGNALRAADDLGNVGFKPANFVKHLVKGATFGDPAADRFATATEALNNELEKFFKGGSPADAAIKRAQERLNTTKTPQEYVSTLHELVDLLQGRSVQLQQRWSGLFKDEPIPLEDFHAIYPQSQAALNMIKQRYGALSSGAGASSAPSVLAAPAAAAPATTPEAGEMRRNKRTGEIQRKVNGQWETVPQ